jgi:hypothetical protein
LTAEMYHHTGAAKTKATQKIRRILNPFTRTSVPYCTVKTVSNM